MQPVRVDFYLLTDQAPSAPWLLACRLLAKAYQQQQSVFVYCKNTKEADYFDELLWTYDENSFIPHRIQDEELIEYSPIRIGWEKPNEDKDILVNFGIEIPAFYCQFRRVIELIPNEENAKAESRRRYADYRAQQCELYFHQV